MTLTTTTTTERPRGLAGRARAAVAEARRRRRPVLAVASVATDLDPIGIAAGAGSDEVSLVLASSLAGGAGPTTVTRAGAGAAAGVELDGVDRFAVAARHAAVIGADVLPDPSAPGWADPRIVAGFAFSDGTDDEPARGGSDLEPSWHRFGAGRLILPARNAAARPGGPTWVSVVARVAPDDRPDAVAERFSAGLRRATTPSPAASPSPGVVGLAGGDAGLGRERWRRDVSRARDRIREGVLEKVVLARSVELSGAGEIDPFAIARSLLDRQPGCLVYAISIPGAGAFVGATPELLVRRRGAAVYTAALAGSTGRGGSAAGDAALGEAMRTSAKERGEHGFVVEGIRAALAPVVDLDPVGAPEVVRLADCQHLRTPIAGRLRVEQSALELAGRLHPTPAVAGTPREAALGLIRAHESFARGWYAGVIGSVDRRGDGELAVSLRCARLVGERAWLFAGAGIVSDSDPDAEWDETEVKLAALRSALLGAGEDRR